MPRKKATDTSTTIESKETKAAETAAETVTEAKTRKAKAVKEDNAEIELLKAQIKALEAEIAAAKSVQPQIVVAAPDNGEKVHLYWQAEVANDNIVEFGDGGMYGRIVGKTGNIFVPKSDISRVLDSANRLFLDMRWLIVISGLTEDEREALGVNYKEGELLDRKAFQKLLSLDKDELLAIYPELCESHKEMIAKRFYEAYTSGNPVDRDTIVALNNIAPVEAFKAIINGMNEEDLGDR